MSSEKSENSNRLGIVLSGSLNKGLDIKLDSGISVESVPVGKYVVINGISKRYFGMVTDISLESVDPLGLIKLQDITSSLISQILQDTTIFVRLHVMITLIISGDASLLLNGPQPAKTVPPHFSPVYSATQRDIELAFGKEDEKHFWIGNPLDMETKVCLNMQEFVKRSNGVFGKSGTGKTFLTRLLLVGMVQKRVGVSLIFDMHSEYGWEVKSENAYKVKGLKQLFNANVAIFTLDEMSSKRRKVTTDFVVRIGYDEIEPEDIALLRQTLNLTEAAINSVYQLAREFGYKHWLEKFFALSEEESKGICDKLNIHESTYRNLRRGLQTLKRFPFLVPAATEKSFIKILEYLERGINVVLEFGNYNDYAAYILVANLLTRRIYDSYRIKTEKAIAEDLQEPTQLVITIEEAHRFLNPELASQTIFGKIAREMRKYNVTLLVIDQRPSGIDEEIMSQLGTKITCLLDNEKDVDSVLAGVSGKSELKYVLSRLESKQQALIFGHAVPMPVVIRTREYGSPESYKSLVSSENELKDLQRDVADLWE